MVNAAHDFELAPVAVLRAAAWPIETLNVFGDRNLADLAHRDLSTHESWNRYVEAYQNTCDRERETLWRITADDSHFMKALLLSNPLVAQRATLLKSRRPTRTKAIRRLENTLYRYLARAVGRTTPGSLWAGVVSVTTGPQTQVQKKTPQYVFTPDLRPFQSILRSLGRRSPYWETTVWHINPTIAQQPDGNWEWWAKASAGHTERRSMPSSDIDPLIHNLLQFTQGTFADFTQNLAQQFGLSELSGIRAVLEQLALGGVLLGGMDLPTTFATPWEALTLAEQLLQEPERQAWHRTVEDLQTNCTLLSDNLDRYSPEEVLHILSESSQRVTALITAFGIAENFPLPDPILHCDFGLPFQVEMGPTEQDSLRQTLATYEREWLQGWSPASALRLEQSLLQRQSYQDGLEISTLGFSQSPLPSSLTWESLCTTYPSISPALNAWNDLLQNPSPETVLSSNVPLLPLPLAPWGCLYVQLQTEWHHAEWHHPKWHQIVQGISDHVTQAFSRFGPLLAVNHSFSDWCQAQLTDFATRYRLLIAEMQEPLEHNPNVLARPSFNLPTISLWAHQGTHQSLNLKRGTFCLDPLTQLPFLHLKDSSDAIAVFGFTSAHICAGNPVAEHLLQTGFQASPTAIFRATTLPVPSEFETLRFTPKVLLSNGQTLRPRRTVVTGSRWTELIEASAEQRFVLWQRLATEQGWPTLLNIEVASKAPLLIPRDSPMALAALFKGLSPEDSFAIVEAVAERPWLKNDRGLHYQCELAQPFRRKEHGWTPRSVDPISPVTLDTEGLSCPN